MSSVKTLITNTVFIYLRSIISAGLALYSSRFVLKALGVSDFGLFSLVGSIIIVISFLNNVMAVSASRHFAVEIGKGSVTDVNKWFNSALILHVILSLFLIISGYPIGAYLINNFFNIDPNRISISLIVFQVSLLSALISMISVPYIAMFTAQQKFGELSILGILQAACTFIAAYMLRYMPGDKIVWHALFLVIIASVFYIIQIIRATIIFPACKIYFNCFFDRFRFVSLLKFAFWNLIAGLGHLIRTQGLIMVTNVFFGTRGNAALGVSNQLSSQASSLSNSLATSTTPEIFRRFGNNQKNSAIELAFQSTKLGIFFILILAIPIISETSNILNLWLTAVPEKTAILCKYAIIMFMIEKTTTGQLAVLQAVNKIARVQTLTGIVFVLTIVICIVLIKVGLNIESVAISPVLTMIGSKFVVIYYFKKHIGVKIRFWIYEILIPYILVSIISLSFSYLITWLFNESAGRLLFNIILTTIVVCICCWFILFNAKEKHYFIENYLVIFKRKKNSSN